MARPRKNPLLNASDEQVKMAMNVLGHAVAKRDTVMAMARIALLKSALELRDAVTAHVVAGEANGMDVAKYEAWVNAGRDIVKRSVELTKSLTTLTMELVEPHIAE